MALDFSNCNWIWTNELPSPGGFVPPGPRAFRRRIPTPDKLTPVHARILITCDNTYILFVNGIKVGTGNDFQTAQEYCVSLHPNCWTVIAVYGANTNPPSPNPAGLLAKVQVTFNNGSTQTIVSDSSWKALNNANIPADFNRLSFDDGFWPTAVTEGVNGNAPWGVVSVPSSVTCKCTGSGTCSQSCACSQSCKCKYH